MSDMNTLDIILLLLLALTLVRGLFRGFVKEISSIVALIVGFILANHYHDQLLPVVSGILPDPVLANLISYALPFIVGVVLVLIIAAVLRYLLKITLLGWVDRLAGGTMGLIKGALLSILIVLLLTTFLLPPADILRTSRFAPYVNQFSALLVELMPPEFRRKFDEKSRHLREQWQERVQERLPQEHKQ
jgi:membrane protein required for colicin V production